MKDARSGPWMDSGTRLVACTDGDDDVAALTALASSPDISAADQPPPAAAANAGRALGRLKRSRREAV